MPAATDNTDIPERPHKAVYWAPGPLDDFGQKTYLAPAEIGCRWSDQVEEYLDAKGNRQVSKAIVYPDRDLRTGGVLWQGSRSQLNNQTDPFHEDNRDEGTAYVIMAWKKVPNWDGDEYLRKAFL